METLQPLHATCSGAHVIAAQTLGKCLFTMRWVEHFFERGGRISSLEVLKSPHGTQQPALSGPALNRELDQMTSRGLSQHRFF